MPTTMRLNYLELIQYIRDWIKDTAGIEVSDGFISSSINLCYLETASKAEWKIERVTVPLVVNQGSYTLEQIASGLSNTFLRPLYMMKDGFKFEENDLEEMIHDGLLDSTADSGDPVAHTWQMGDLLLVPSPDASAVAAAVIVIFYAAAPARLSDSAPDLDVKFRTQWQEALCWMVLGRRLAALKVDEQAKSFVSPTIAVNQIGEWLKVIHDDVWFQKTRRIRLKDRGAKNDADALKNNFYQN